jgi:plasmid stability protein
MAQILVRNLEPALVERLKERARRNRRSLQAEVTVVLEEAAGLEPPHEDMWAFAARTRAKLAGRPQTDSVELVREDRER